MQTNAINHRSSSSFSLVQLVLVAGFFHRVSSLGLECKQPIIKLLVILSLYSMSEADSAAAAAAEEHSPKRFVAANQMAIK